MRAVASVPMRAVASVSLLAVASVALASSIALSLAACQGRAAAESGQAPVGVTPSLAASATPAAPGIEHATAPVARSAEGAVVPAAASPVAAEKAPVTRAAAAVSAVPAVGSAAAAEAEAKADGPQQGKVVSEAPYSTWLQAPAPVGVGAPAQLEAVLVAKAPYHCNPDYPHKFKLNAAPAGLSYPEELVRGMQVSPERGVLRIPVLAKSAGPATVSGTLSFSVCNDERCLVEKKELSLALQVK